MFNKLAAKATTTALAVRNDEEGQAMVEYGLILALVSVVAAAVLLTIGGDVTDTFDDVVSALNPA